MGYSQQQLGALPPGFGFLVPRSERRRMLACTFVHNKFPHRAPEAKGCCAAFLAVLPTRLHELSDGEVEQIVRQELKSVLRLDTEPRFIRVYRWRRAMAQYSVGHLDRVTRIEAAAERLPAFAIAGNCFRASACRTAFAPDSKLPHRWRSWRQGHGSRCGEWRARQAQTFSELELLEIRPFRTTLSRRNGIDKSTQSCARHGAATRRFESGFHRLPHGNMLRETGRARAAQVRVVAADSALIRPRESREKSPPACYNDYKSVCL